MSKPTLGKIVFGPIGPRPIPPPPPNRPPTIFPVGDAPQIEILHEHHFVPFPERNQYETRMIFCESCGEVRTVEPTKTAK